jgi:BirA family biotin operon repressor/biotin-[acetyl-CoA-carboxylase] ligase
VYPEVVPDAFAAPLARAWPRLVPAVRAVRYYPCAGSTMDLAAAEAEVPDAEGLLVIADTQTGGRGRRGRTWVSPGGVGLYVSLLLRPPVAPAVDGTPSAVGLLTIAAGVAVAEGIAAATGLHPSLKWPNDVVHDGRKIAGVLAEGHAIGTSGQAVVLGLGVNVRATTYPPELAAIATSVEAATGRRADRGEVLAEILMAFAGHYADLRAGRFDGVVRAWRARALLGRPVVWHAAGGLVAGVATGLEADGALTLQAEGATHHVRSGEVRWL